jgi:hypothetical protein
VLEPLRVCLTRGAAGDAHHEADMTDTARTPVACATSHVVPCAHAPHARSPKRKMEKGSRNRRVRRSRDALV